MVWTKKLRVFTNSLTDIFCFYWYLKNSIFSRVIKNHIFHRRNLLENHLRHLKLYSILTRRLTRSCCHASTLWKTASLSSHFKHGQHFRFFYMRFHLQGRLQSTKEMFLFNLRLYFSLFLWKNVYINKSFCVKAKSIWLNKYWYF